MSRTLVLAAACLLVAAPLGGQATNPLWISQFPTAARVKEAMKVADPRETAIRQIGAFWQLQEIIKTLSGSREFRGHTPDEARVMTWYREAEYYTGTAIDSAFPGPYGRMRKVSENTPFRLMRTDPRFGVEGIEIWALLPAAVADQFYQTIGAEKTRWAARARADSQSRLHAQAEQGQESGLAQDQARIRRCVEAGRSQMQCVMEGLGRGFMDLASAALPGLGLKKELVHGIRMGGVYPGASRLNLIFYTDVVNITCHDLEPESHRYSTAVVADGVRLTIENNPKPIVLTMRADGRLAGPGPTDITGQVQTGVQEGTRTWSDGRTEPISRPVYATMTRRCNFGAGMVASGPSPALGSGSAIAATVLNLAFGSPDPDAGKPTPAGLRMSGEYGTQSAFGIEFRPEGAVVGCGPVTALRPYTVTVQGTRVMVNVENAGSPFALTVGADGRLSGTGSVKVDGRQVTGSAPDGSIAFAPRSATCPLGVIGPTQANLSQAEQGAAAARASLGQPAPGAGASAPAGNGPAFQIAGGLPAPAFGGNALADRSFMLLDVSLDNILREAGVAQPAGTSAPRLVEQTCTTASAHADCAKIVQAMGAHTVAMLKADASGVANTPDLTAGKTYYLFGSAVSLGKKVTWHLPLKAQAGWTRVVLSTANAAP